MCPSLFTDPDIMKTDVLARIMKHGQLWETFRGKLTKTIHPVVHISAKCAPSPLTDQDIMEIAVLDRMLKLEQFWVF